MGAAKKLWKNFETMTDLTYVMRKGYEVCGVYVRDKEDAKEIHVSPDLLLRQESTAEHSARVANLLSEVMVWYPMYFSGVDTFLAMKTALNHDVGEVKVGDVCDDGNRAHDLKADAEWRAVKDFYENLPTKIRDTMLDYHRQFEDCSTLLGQMIKMVDKLDAIGRLILYEKRGLYGDVYYKSPPSEQDIKFAEDVGTGNCTDVWARHMQNLFDKYDFRSQVVGVAKDFLTVGLQSIGKPFFSWWQ